MRASCGSVPPWNSGYVDQNRDALDPDKTVYEEISGGHDTLAMGGRKPSTPAPTLPASISAARIRKRRWHAVGRRTQSRPSGQAAASRLERAAAGRTDERSGRRYPAGFGRGDPQLCGLRGRDQPRPLVPRPDRHAHSGVRGGRLRALVRRELSDVRTATSRAVGYRQRASRDAFATSDSPSSLASRPGRWPRSDSRTKCWQR